MVKSTLVELKTLVFEQNKATKQNKTTLFKLAKAEKDIECIKKLRDNLKFKSAKIYLEKFSSTAATNKHKKLEEIISLKIPFNNNTKKRSHFQQKESLTIHDKELLAATQVGDIKKVKKLIEMGIDINISNLEGLTPLMIAHDNFELVKLLIDNKADINFKGQNEMTALLFAVREKKYELVNLLINNGADINIQGMEGMTALIYAVILNQKEIIKLLLNHNADITLKFGDLTALDIAFTESKIEKIKDSTIETLISLSAKNINLAELYLFSSNLNFIEIALKNGADINAKSSSNLTCLEMASNDQLVNHIQLLIEHNAINKEIDYAGKALLFAVENKNKTIIEILLRNGANTDTQDANGFTALMISIYYDNQDIFELLMKYNKDINIQNTSGETALHYAVHKSNINIIKILINIDNINLNIQNENGDTALIFAVKLKNLEVIKLLLDSKASTIIESKDIFGDEGETALTIACRDNDLRTNDNIEIIKFILKYKCTLSRYEAIFFDTLLYDNEIAKLTSKMLVVDDAIETETLLISIVRMYRNMHNTVLSTKESKNSEQYNILIKCNNLLKHGVDINYSSSNETALSIAKNCDFPELIKLLQKYKNKKISHKNSTIAFNENKYAINFIGEDIMFTDIVKVKTEKLTKDVTQKNAYINIDNNLFKITTDTVVIINNSNEKVEYKINFMLGNPLEINNNHNPKELVKLLSNFTNDTPLKYTTHSWDFGTLQKVYGNFAGFMKVVKAKWKEIEEEVEFLSPELHKKIYDFILNDKPSYWNTEDSLNVGWSSLEGLAKWCDSDKNPFDFKLDSSIIVKGQQIDTFGKVINLFKKEIEIRKEGDILENLFIEQEDRLDLYFDVECIKLKGKKFYTNTEYLKKSLTRIFDIIKKYGDIEKLFEIEVKCEENEYIDIVILHVDSESNTSVSEMLKAKDRGDFQELNKTFENLCDWSIESSYEDENYRVNYLRSDSSVKEIEKLDYKPKGFTYRLRFYK